MPLPPPATRPAALAVRRSAAVAAATVALVLPPLAAPGALGAQSATADSAAPSRVLLDAGELRTAGWFALGAVAVAPFDGRIAAWSQRPALQRSRALGRAADVLNAWGQPGVVVAVPLLWAAGRAAERDALATAAVRGGEAVVASGVVTALIKYAAGRARPAVDVTDPTSFAVGRGLREGGDYQSFPSGHATAAFAFASAVTAQATVGHPGRRWSVGLPLYAVAAGTAWARIHDNRHWASDVVGGAAVGTVAGLATVRFHRARPGGRLDRWFLAVHVTPAAGGGNGVRLSILPR